MILARGLGLLRLVTNLLHFYDAAGNNLVLVVGADDRENEWIGEGTFAATRTVYWWVMLKHNDADLCQHWLSTMLSAKPLLPGGSR